MVRWAWLLAGCITAPALASPQAPPPSSPVVRLLDRLAPDDVVPGTPISAAGEPLLLREPGEAAPPRDLHRVVVPLPGTAWAVVRARVRSGGTPIVVSAQALRRKVATDAEPAADDRIEPNPAVVPPPFASTSLAADEERGWQVLELTVEPCVGRRALEVTVAAKGGVALARLEVADLVPVRRLLDAPRLPGDRSTVPWRRIVRRGTSSADALLLHPGGRARWRLDVPQRSRLAARLGSAAPADAALRSTLTIDGAPVFPPPTGPAGDDRLVPWELDLSNHGGHAIELEWSLPADAPGTLLIAAPRLMTVPAAGDRARPNLVVISIDTLRADQVGCFGGDATLTPAIDRLAAGGVRFPRFIAASSWTLPSHATLFSSQEPPIHGANRIGDRVEPARTPLLAPALAEAGWITAAFTGGGFMDPAFGLSAGFDHYSIRDPGRAPPPPRAVTEEPMEPAVRWITRHRDLPFFLFLHTYAVHDYSPDDDALAAVAPAGSKLRARDAAGLVARFGAGETALAPELRTLYRAALWQVDQRLVRRLLDTLDALGLTERTVVALVSDHGDQWLEHDGIFHGNELWQELVRVPWIVSGPGVARGEVRDEVVGHLDVAPTLLARLGVAPAPSMRGADALAAGFEPQPALSRVFSPDGSHVASVTAWPWRLLRKVVPEGAPELRLYRLDVDPLEQDDRAAREPQCAAALLDWLEEKLAECEAEGAATHAGAGARVTIDADLRRQLDSLGYAAK